MRHYGIHILALILAAACHPPKDLAQRLPDVAAPDASPPHKAEPLEVPEGSSLENVHRLGRRLINGSAPESEADFSALSAWGVRTIISVDGQKPPVEMARTRRMRYVHLPFGYDGIPEERASQLAAAIRQLPGPLYIHCHHGLHRSPPAAAIGAMSVEGWTAEEALTAIAAIGTSPHYQGLYEAIRQHSPATSSADGIDASALSESEEVPPVAARMAALDRDWDRLKHGRGAGWQSANGGNDINNAVHDALMVLEHLREINRLEVVRDDYPSRVRREMQDAEKTAEMMEVHLRSQNWKSADVSFAALSKSCQNCHETYRD